MKKTITFLSILFLSFSFEANSQISSFPYVQTGGNPVGWSTIQTTDSLWYLGFVGRNPSNVANDTALICNFYYTTPGQYGIVKSPVFDFTSLSRPVVHFYTAYRSFGTRNDSLIFLVSTNGGVTFNDVPTPYRKSFNSTPSLATGPSQTSQYNPGSPGEWRHETVDLGVYAGQSNISVGFYAKSANGNELWIDNFIVTNADNYCQTSVSSPGDYSCSISTVTMNTIGLALSRENNLSTDNPSGGVLSFAQHDNQYPVPSYANTDIASNTTATTHDGTIFTPNIIAPDSWFTISYSGNDLLGYANYDIKIDISGFISVIDVTKLYIVKRSDLLGSWQCLNTTASGSTLMATGLTTFSDFAVGGDSNINPLPVELFAFTYSVNRRDVTLNWITSTEISNSGFEIERSNVISGTSPDWNKIGFIEGNGTTSSTNHYSFTDRGLNSGKYKYRLKQIDFNGNFKYYNLNNEVNIGVSSSFKLIQNYPNPFNPTTFIDYEIPELSNVNISIFDMSGKEVKTLFNEKQDAGYYTIKFDGSDLSSGVYFYRLTAITNGQSRVATKKMFLVK